MWYTEDTEGELFEARFRICRQGGISMKTTFVGKRQEQTAEFISSTEKKLGKFDRFFEDATAQIKTDKKKDGESVELTASDPQEQDTLGEKPEGRGVQAGSRGAGRRR